MNEKYSHYPKHYIAVDCAIFGYELGELRLLLYPRGFEPRKGKWSLIGGFVGEEESAEDAAKRILFQTTGLTDVFLEQVGVFSDVDRDPEARVVSVTSVALVRLDRYDRDLVRKKGAQWWPVTEIPELIFDHALMVRKSLESIQNRASSTLLGQELLPDKFTLTQLRTLYDTIFQRTFEPANFRKKVLSLNVLKRLNIKNTTESKKGAFYYQFETKGLMPEGQILFRIN